MRRRRKDGHTVPGRGKGTRKGPEVRMSVRCVRMSQRLA